MPCRICYELVIVGVDERWVDGMVTVMTVMWYLSVIVSPFLVIAAVVSFRKSFRNSKTRALACLFTGAFVLISGLYIVARWGGIGTI
jgi:uncharacterized membrane protein